MMSRRPLDPVTSGAAALRRLTMDDTSAADITRARVLARMDGRRHRPRLSGRTILLLLLVLVLVGSTGLAATLLVRAGYLQRASASHQPVPGHKAATRAARSDARTRSPPTGQLAIVDVATEPEPEPEPGPAPPLSPKRQASPPPMDAAGAVDRELDTYGAAHAAHFVARDFARALPLWNGYLRYFPRGRFVPEATFNRAIALVRLGRRSAAVEALRPLAGGRFDGFRRVEAQALLEALRRP